MSFLSKIALVTVILCFTISAYARVPINLGVKAGLGISNLSGILEDNKTKIGYNAGLTIDFEVAPSFYLVSGLEFTTKPLEGVKGNSIGDLENGWLVTASRIKTNASYLQIPAHMAYKLNLSEDTKISFHVGPYVAYGIGGETEALMAKIVMYPGHNTEGQSTSVTTSENKTFGSGGFKHLDLGFSGGVTFELMRFNVNVDYDLGITKHEPIDLKVRNGKVYFSLGYKFLSR